MFAGDVNLISCLTYLSYTGYKRQSVILPTHTAHKKRQKDKENWSATANKFTPFFLLQSPKQHTIQCPFCLSFVKAGMYFWRFLYNKKKS